MVQGPGKSGRRGDRPKPAILDLPSTEVKQAEPVTPEMAATPDVPAAESVAAPSPDAPASAPGDLVEVPAPVAPGDVVAGEPVATEPETVAAAAETGETKPGEPADGAALDDAPAVKTPWSDVGKDSTTGASDAPVEEPVLNQHGVDPAVFDRPGPSSAGSLAFGAFAGMAASLLVILGLASLDMMPGSVPAEMRDRLTGVEASIRSIVTDQGRTAGTDNPEAVQRAQAAEALAREAGERVEALRNEVVTLGTRLTDATSGQTSAPAVEAVTRDVAGLKDAVGQAQAAIAAVPAATSQQIAELNSQIEALKKTIQDLSPQVSTLSGRQAELGTAVAGLQGATSVVAKTQARLEDLDRKQEALTSDVDTLRTTAQLAEENKQHLSATDAQVAALEKRVAEPVVDRAARQLLLLETVESALAAGRPFTDQATALAALQPGAAMPELHAAASGVPTAVALAAEARRLLTGLPEDNAQGDLLGRLAASARSLVKVTADGAQPSADDLRGTFVADLSRGDYDAALAVLPKLDPMARTALTDVAANVQRRRDAERALATTRASALAAIAGRS